VAAGRPIPAGLPGDWRVTHDPSGAQILPTGKTPQYGTLRRAGGWAAVFAATPSVPGMSPSAPQSVRPKTGGLAKQALTQPRSVAPDRPSGSVAPDRRLARVAPDRSTCSRALRARPRSNAFDASLW
jgi:hypothetical protein